MCVCVYVCGRGSARGSLQNVFSCGLCVVCERESVCVYVCERESERELAECFLVWPVSV